MAILSNTNNRHFAQLDPVNPASADLIQEALNTVKSAFGPVVTLCAEPDTFTRDRVVAKIQDALQQLTDMLQKIQSAGSGSAFVSFNLVCEAQQLEQHGRQLAGFIESNKDELRTRAKKERATAQTPATHTNADIHDDLRVCAALQTTLDTLQTHPVLKAPTDFSSNPFDNNFIQVTAANTLHDHFQARMSKSYASDAAILASTDHLELFGRKKK